MRKYSVLSTEYLVTGDVDPIESAPSNVRYAAKMLSSLGVEIRIEFSDAAPRFAK